MELIPTIGTLAALFSTLSFAPQAWKIIRQRDTSAISARMYMLTVSGFCCWFLYGLLRGDWPLIVTNFICLLLSAFILTMKLLPWRQRDAVADKIAPAEGE
ncbi:MULTISPECIES: SemiSWEET family sugar transporter [unclassified Azospirillum]|uniref:SemiSWEET family sugar transporter n=1 Tax=unclassified Azospirillum TaxID=2630922 RepID=UPI000B6CC11D|nr:MULTISPECIES: SemiSWEET transporter [unclassified Azospirillum]SNS80022.1 MtN3 and saliva related transmembrane protein [Azospirillum sp. RU38E]SNS97269.1 MtN3 and saliva related transmembrane protein [Azospirillum sp. RU37A]